MCVQYFPQSNKLSLGQIFLKKDATVQLTKRDIEDFQKFQIPNSKISISSMQFLIFNVWFGKSDKSLKTFSVLVLWFGVW